MKKKVIVVQKTAIFKESTTAPMLRGRYTAVYPDAHATCSGETEGFSGTVGRDTEV
jgi:hypothetical protein